MEKWKHLGINLGISIALFFLGLLFLSTFSYFNVLNGKVLTGCKFVIIFLTFFIGSFRQGKQSHKNGYIEGLKIGGILLLFIILGTYLLNSSFTVSNIFYYTVLLLISMAGGIFGISKHKEAK